MNERQEKMEIYEIIAIVSKDLNGFKMRLDIDQYSVEELKEILRGLK